MEVQTHASADEFRDVAEPLYRRDPVANTIELTLLRAGTFDDDALLLTVWNDGEPTGATLQTPPYPLACNGLPLYTHALVAAELARLRPNLGGVRGRRDVASAFADTWLSAAGGTAAVAMRETLYRLGTLKPPTDVRGAHRDAVGGDRPVLVDWVEGFFAEAFGHQRDDAAGERFVDNANAVGDRFVIWEVDGTPVSMAMLRAPAAGVSRIGPVFTPRGSRGHGYGSAVTAAAADLARRDGVDGVDGVDDVVLFADLANPTSNAIYRKVGFEQVLETVRIDFASGR